MPNSAIVFSKEADNLFEKLFLSGFKEELIKEIASVEDARIILDGEIGQLVFAISQDEDLNNDVRQRTLKLLRKAQETTDYTLLAAAIEEQVLANYFISSMPIPSYIQALTAVKLGFAIKINTGISVKLSGNKTWQSMVKAIWQKCFTDVHPFQKGDTNQGTTHCVTIVENLNKLYDLLRKKGIKPILEEAVILLVAAAVHDVGKSLAVKDEHQEIGSDFINSNYRDLLIESDWQIPIAKIIEYHAGKNSLMSPSLPTSLDFNVPDKRGTMTKLNVNVQKLAALFRFLDVSDMTHTRISDIVFSLNEQAWNKGKLDETTRNKLFSRNHIDKLEIWPDHFNIIVSSKIADPGDLDIIKNCVKYDNEQDLDKYDVSSILRSGTMPCEFRVNGKRPS